jgi:hypothetical protein
MSTKNVTKGVFIHLIGSDTEIPSYDVLLNYKVSKDKTLKKYTSEYSNLITKHKPIINNMGKLEEIILQLRAVENLENIKLSIVRDYIYARCPFFRLGKSSKDIRIIVDRSEFWSVDLKSLLNNQNFMDKAKSKLIDAMNIEIKNNITEYEAIK